MDTNVERQPEVARPNVQEAIDLVSKSQHWKRFICTTIEKMLLCKRL